jgi:hypothetical protein
MRNLPEVPQFREWGPYGPYGPVPWPPGDPAPWMYGVLKEEEQIKVTQLAVAYKLQVAQAQMEFYKQFSQLLTMAKGR